jgi:hypothetical protein
MLERLGNALYWAACVLGILVLGLGTFLAYAMIDRDDTILVLIVASAAAVLIWLFGRAGRYVLAAK